jgi:hypothetical protein
MPSFLSKVFGRKTLEDRDYPPTEARNSSGTLLDGRFEVVSPPVSPTAQLFTGGEQGFRNHSKEKETRFTLFRLKSRTSEADLVSPKSAGVPHLTLDLPGSRENPSPILHPDSQHALPEAVIGERRLSPSEALTLVRACSQWMTERGVWTSSAKPFFSLQIFFFLQASKLSESCIRIGTPHPPTSNANLFLCSYNLCLPGPQRITRSLLHRLPLLYQLSKRNSTSLAHPTTSPPSSDGASGISSSTALPLVETLQNGLGTRLFQMRKDPRCTRTRPTPSFSRLNCPKLTWSSSLPRSKSSPHWRPIPKPTAYPAASSRNSLVYGCSPPNARTGKTIGQSSTRVGNAPAEFSNICSYLVSGTRHAINV